MIETFPLILAIAQPPAAAQLVPEPPVLSAAQVVTGVRTPLPPADWSTLPELPYLRRTPDMEALSAFVRDEVAAGRCIATGRVGAATVVTLDLAVLVAPDGHIRRIVPRAIDCVTVEQYGSGLVSRLARDNLDTAGITAEAWFRTTLIFSWSA